MNHSAVADSDGSRVSADGHWLQALVTETALRIAVPRNPGQYAEQVFGQEQAFGRAITFSDPSIPVNNIVGERFRMRISDWRAPGIDENYPLRRAEVWYQGLDPEPESEAPRIFDNVADGEPPRELLDFSAVKHSETRILSLIDLPLWDGARWRGMGYALGPDLSEPPILGIAFRNADSARKILTHWRAKLGEVDQEEQLRVSLITGVDKRHPFSYTVVIGSNPRISTTSGIHHFVSVSRVHRQDPPDSKNVDAFVARFERIGGYRLVPAHLESDSKPPTFFFDLWIGKRAMRVTPAWKLGENDPDSVGLQPDDDPIIPDGV